MTCANCGFDNPEGMKFCEECGAKLTRLCPDCGREVRPTAKFCGECGASLVLSAESRVLSPSQPPTPKTQPPIAYTPAHLAERIRAVTITDGERKTITALFADLKGSTALIEDLDPEEAQRVIDPALQLMLSEVYNWFTEGFDTKDLQEAKALIVELSD